MEILGLTVMNLWHIFLTDMTQKLPEATGVNGKKAYMDVDGLLQLDDAGYYYYNAAYQVTKNGDDSYNASWRTPC